MTNIDKNIVELVDYGIRKKLIEDRDKIYVINRIINILKISEFNSEKKTINKKREVSDILEDFRIFALKNELVEDNTVEDLDLFDTKLMNCFAKRPSEFEKEFWTNYKKSPKKATEFYYDFSKNINYIREDRIKKDIKWVHETEYGDLDITINMSKPEKDPKSIEKAKLVKESNYPKCLLCKENEGYPGRISYPSRDNHRIIALDLADEPWYMQYSPYVYYNEHCIVLKGSHDSMQITSLTFRRLLEFVEKFPHYRLGSNADLPIVGGSILTHDHFQGGNYSFSMEKAKEINHTKINDKVELSTLKWPLSVIRIKGEEKEELIVLASRILNNWIDYTDADANIISHTDDTRHNTITPVARFRDGKFEIDLVLRNNRCDEKSPHGIFHPRAEYHNIKRENIGIIEVMGLAVLPSRLKKEMGELETFLIEDDLEAIKRDKNLNKHYDFASIIKEKHELNKENIEGIIQNEIGIVFSNLLKDAGIFKDTKIGQAAFKKCVKELLILKNK